MFFDLFSFFPPLPPSPSSSKPRRTCLDLGYKLCYVRFASFFPACLPCPYLGWLDDGGEICQGQTDALRLSLGTTGRRLDRPQCCGREVLWRPDKVLGRTRLAYLNEKAHLKPAHHLFYEQQPAEMITGYGAMRT